jgi:two-component system, sensor histidine kinase and response regulator
MGGTIEVQSELGKGSNFRFTLSFQAVRGAEGLGEERAYLRDLPVLVVDDNSTARLVLHQMLARLKMKPVLAENGHAALALAQSAYQRGLPYALVLLDANMPQLDGFQTAVKLNSNPRFSTPIVMMLGSAAPQQDAERCLAIEISHYLVKPVRLKDLLETTRNALAATSAGASTLADAPESLSRADQTLVAPARILLAEDNPVNQQLALRLLQKMGYSVVLSRDGKEALRALEHEAFDLVLMDVQMPEMDGFAATAAIREQEITTGKHIPIIAMTARAMKGDRERCLEAGMDDYISKPVHRKELNEVIARNLSGRKGPVAREKGKAAATSAS